MIDDSLGQLAAIATGLKSAGYKDVFTASDWAQCRAALAKGNPTLVIIDINLPGMVSGDLMAAQLRKDPRAAAARIIFHSGMKERDLAALAARSRADAFVVKGSVDTLVAKAVAIAPP